MGLRVKDFGLGAGREVHLNPKPYESRNLKRAGGGECRLYGVRGRGGGLGARVGRMHWHVPSPLPLATETRM